MSFSKSALETKPLLENQEPNPNGESRNEEERHTTTKVPEKVDPVDPVVEGLASEIPKITGSCVLKSAVDEETKRSQRRCTDILDSAETKDLAWMQRCLEIGNSSPEATCRENMLSVCHIAAYFGDLGILKEIIKRRPDLFNRADSLGRTPLHYAVWGGHLDCLAVLLGLSDDGLAVDWIKKRKEPRNITEIKIGENNLKWLNSIHGEGVQLPNELVCGSTHTCSTITKALEAVWSSCTPLHNACARVQTDSVLALLACGADITMHDEQGRTPLDVCGIAVKEVKKIAEIKPIRFVIIIEAFIKHGKHYKVKRDLWLTNQNKTSPLHVAVLFNSKKATKLLLDIKADPCLLDEDGQTPIHLAVLNRRTHILKALANSPSNKITNDVDVLNRDERTPLQLAVLEQWSEGVSILLDANVSVINQLNSDRNSALHFAAQVGDLEITKELIEKLTNINESIDIKNKSGETPFFVVIKNGHHECVSYFLQNGAGYNLVFGSFTVLHKAIESDNRDVLKSLLQMERIGYLLNITDTEYGMTPLHWAALKGKDYCVESLIDKGADLKLQNKAGLTALHIAAREGHSGVIKVILEKNKDNSLISIRDNDGWFPFYTAVHDCRRESIELFLLNGASLAEIFPNESKNLIIEIIKSKMVRPAEFLTKIFDSCITFPSAYNFDHPESEIVLNYSVLIPDEQSENQTQIDAIAALLSRGSSPEIKKLISHPIIESFVFRKWKTLQPLFYVILVMYFIFVALFTFVTVQMCEFPSKSVMFAIELITLMLVTNGLLTVEIYLMKQCGWKKYFRRLACWVKPCSLIMADVVMVFYWCPFDQNTIRWIIGVSYLFCWMEIPIMLSRFQQLGDYNQMFYNVAQRAVKVFAFFGCFVIIGFSLIFWILKADDSFSTLWNSFIKTVVMMTSEYEYSSMLDNSVKVNQVAFQIFFIIFMLSVPIVLMNLLLALAVTDVKNLKIEGKTQRFMEQVAFLGNMEILVRKNIFKKFIDRYFSGNCNVKKIIKVYPGKSYREKTLPKNIIQRLLENINKRKEINMEAFVNRIEQRFTKLEETINRMSEDQTTIISEENTITPWYTLLKNGKKM